MQLISILTACGGGSRACMEAGSEAATDVDSADMTLFPRPRPLVIFSQSSSLL